MFLIPDDSSKCLLSSLLHCLLPSFSSSPPSHLFPLAPLPLSLNKHHTTIFQQPPPTTILSLQSPMLTTTCLSAPPLSTQPPLCPFSHFPFSGVLALLVCGSHSVLGCDGLFHLLPGTYHYHDCQHKRCHVHFIFSCTFWFGCL